VFASIAENGTKLTLAVSSQNPKKTWTTPIRSWSAVSVVTPRVLPLKVGRFGRWVVVKPHFSFHYLWALKIKRKVVFGGAYLKLSSKLIGT
jgi:hypothetical protein